MDKKDQLISFRLTEDNLNYLKQLAESDERSVSYILNKMIESYKEHQIIKVNGVRMIR